MGNSMRVPYFPVSKWPKGDPQPVGCACTPLTPDSVDKFLVFIELQVTLPAKFLWVVNLAVDSSSERAYRHEGFTVRSSWFAAVTSCKVRRCHWLLINFYYAPKAHNYLQTAGENLSF